MARTHRVVLGTAAALLSVAVSGCTVDTVIWGAQGAKVIATTEQFVNAAAAGDGALFVCEGDDVDLRAPGDWNGLSAEEPGPFIADQWPDQVRHHPAWTINLSLPSDRVATGVEFPGDIFYRETGDTLCLVDVVWSTVG